MKTEAGLETGFFVGFEARCEIAIEMFHALCYCRVMMMQRAAGWMGVLVIALSLVATAEAAKHRESYVICKNKGTVRTLRVEIGGGERGVCETVYTKGGIDRSVGSAQNSASCMTIMNNIKANLEAAAWTCKDVTAKATMSDATQASDDQANFDP